MSTAVKDELPPPFRVSFKAKDEAEIILRYLKRHGGKKGPAAYQALLEKAKAEEATRESP